MREIEAHAPGRFLGHAARTMRGLVVDRLRAAGASALPAPVMSTHEMEAIANVLEELAGLEPELAEVVDLKFYCGFTFAEVARMQGVSERTVLRQWEKARALLFSAISN